MVLVLMMGRMADGGEGWCVLSSVLRLGQWLGVTIVVCMFLVVSFVVIVLVSVISAIVIVSVCRVAGFVGMVVTVMVVIWVVGRAIIVVLFAFVVGFDVVGFGCNVNSMVVVIIYCSGCWCVFSFDGTWKKGSGQKHKGQFDVESIQFLEKGNVVWFGSHRMVTGCNDGVCRHDCIGMGLMGAHNQGTCQMNKKFKVLVKIVPVLEEWRVRC